MSKKIEIPIVNFEPIVADDGTRILHPDYVNSKIDSIFRKAKISLEKQNKFASFEIDFENNEIESNFYILSHHMYWRARPYQGSFLSRDNPADCFEVLKNYYNNNIKLHGTYDRVMTMFFGEYNSHIHFEGLYFPIEIYEKSTLSIMAKEFIKSQKAEKN